MRTSMAMGALLCESWSGWAAADAAGRAPGVAAGRWARVRW